jgi:hypothetical protein
MKFVRFLVLAFLSAQSAIAAIHIQQNGSSNYAKILHNGSSAEKYDIVFVGDGFTANDQTAFNNAVTAAVDALRARPGFAEGMCGFNIWRVNVVSTESGIDHPKDNIFKNTELDCRYGNPANGEAERCITSDSAPKCFEAAAYAPDADAIFVLVNDTQWGGCAGDIVFSAIADSFDQLITHELGHKVGRLADEYECYVCDGSDDGRTYSGSERPQPNATIDTNRATTKWADLIDAATLLPTTANNPVGVVGLVEGGDYFAKGIFRPQFDCHMRATASPLCAVCLRAIQQALLKKCSYCELHPGSRICQIMDLLANVHTRYRQPFHFRFPIPVCLSCPFTGRPEDDVVLEFTGVEQGFKVQIVDDLGNAVAEGQTGGGTLVAAFAAKPDRTYTAELISGERPSGAMLDIGAKLTRNGQVQQLPAITR